MLEHLSLLLQSWRIVPEDLSSRAGIVEPFTGVPLGFAHRPRLRGPGWLRWLRRPFIAIHETDDEPLLMTLRQGLGPRASWSVADADGHHVGRVRAGRLLDPRDDLLALREPGGDNGHSVYRAGREELAFVEREAEGVRITFQRGERDNPFVRMVLLAAALIHHGRERGSAAGAPFASRF